MQRALLRVINLHMTVMMNHAVNRILRHLLRHTRVLKSHDGHMRWHCVHRQNRVHSSTVIDDRFERGLPRK